MKTRGFEVINKFIKEDGTTDINIPVRKTAKSAGYDIEAIEEIYIYPKQAILVPTGLKAYMLDDEVLKLYVRSSLAIKRSLSMTNDVGIIDADYYNNVDNEGHIHIPLYNFGVNPVTIKKGERIAQGIFVKFLTVDGDVTEGERVGGIGSTDSEATATLTEAVTTPVKKATTNKRGK